MGDIYCIAGHLFVVSEFRLEFTYIQKAMSEQFGSSLMRSILSLYFSGNSMNPFINIVSFVSERYVPGTVAPAVVSEPVT